MSVSHFVSSHSISDFFIIVLCDQWPFVTIEKRLWLTESSDDGIFQQQSILNQGMCFLEENHNASHT